MASATPTAQMSVGLVALGLLIERPDNGYQLEQRLHQRLGASGYAKGAVEHALERLERDGDVLRVEGEYVATEGGVVRFERWLHASTSLPPLREELLARVALCRPRNMPRMIQVIREAQLACVSQLEAYNASVLAEEARTDLMGWERHTRCAVLSGEAAWWDARVDWLAQLREGLERALAAHRAEVQAPRPGPPGSV